MLRVILSKRRKPVRTASWAACPGRVGILLGLAGVLGLAPGCSEEPKVCGDGIVAGSEECDDGNTLYNDGCGMCHVETGWTCWGEPSSCAPVCGDDLCVVTGAETAGGCPQECTTLAISEGGEHACGLFAGGVVRCWRDNEDGQLGIADLDYTFPAAIPVEGLPGRAVAVTAGGHHSCALLADGTVWCWGRNTNGQLGEAASGEESATPVQVAGLSNVQAVSAGNSHTCAVLADGTVSCWGGGWPGTLGNESGENSIRPVPVVGLTDAVAVSAGGVHTCALRRDGTVWCWGPNMYGVLGRGTKDATWIPGPVVGLREAVAVTAGWLHACALLADGTVSCWGWNEAGQLGAEVTEDSSAPVPVEGLTDVVAVSAGEERTCAVRQDGTVWCWGDVYQPGDDPAKGPSTEGPVPVPIEGISEASSIAVGHWEACAILSDGTPMCW